MFLWRNLNIENKITNIIQKYEVCVPYALDQGIVNLALMNKIKLVHRRYNCMSIFTVFNMMSYWISSTIGIESILKLRKLVKIRRLCIMWRYFVWLVLWSRVRGPYYDEWRACKARSLWADEPLCSNNKRKYLRFLYPLPQTSPRWRLYQSSDSCIHG